MTNDTVPRYFSGLHMACVQPMQQNCLRHRKELTATDFIARENAQALCHWEGLRCRWTGGQVDRGRLRVKAHALMNGTLEQHSYLLLLEDGLVFLKR